MKKNNDRLATFEIDRDPNNEDNVNVRILVEEKTVAQVTDYVSYCAASLMRSAINSDIEAGATPNPYEIKDLIMNSVSLRLNAEINTYFENVSENAQ